MTEKTKNKKDYIILESAITAQNERMEYQDERQDERELLR